MEYLDEITIPNPPKIVVIGAGGGGSNTVERLACMGISGAELIAVNTDIQHLSQIRGQRIKKLPIGFSTTRGFGTGGDPAKGRAAAYENQKELEESLRGYEMVFLVAGMGGGTGTGSAPVIAKIAKDLGAVVVGVVTLPFEMEGSRIDKARKGVEELTKNTDSVIVIDNNKLLGHVQYKPVNEALMDADRITAGSIKSIIEIVTVPGLVNLDFADIKTVMSQGGISMMNTGIGEGLDRVEEAVKNTLNNPFIDADCRGAKGVLISITGGNRMTLDETNEILELMTKDADEWAHIIYGARINSDLGDKVEITAVMTGLGRELIVDSAAYA